jgi:hypothetical protein
MIRIVADAATRCLKKASSHVLPLWVRNFAPEDEAKTCDTRHVFHLFQDVFMSRHLQKQV